ncbi:hypothetical protein R3W88_024877 [Solanum pinnatisectum]|uniref:RNA exonuclease 4 n=1 Tax=Solanum pinnatisectum TaxID=50273 RepID=A0AAV9M1U2_9SOLN|nr:hypothetical protein R3W88_024877 [Solanum pinnatisectum]
MVLVKKPIFSCFNSNIRFIGYQNVEVEPSEIPLQPLSTTRHKCPACYKQCKEKEHIVEHMRTSHHSVHDPKCGVCNKHCKSFESLREHIAGPLTKVSCSSVFAERGCILCLKICSSMDSLNEHKETCRLTTPQPIEKVEMHRSADEMINIRGQEVVTIDCVMVGGGWSQELCARVCLVDEDEKIIFQTYVLPPTPVADYRYEITGITEENLQNAMPLEEVRERIRQILYSGEQIGRVLVGHNLETNLRCLKLSYFDHLQRDTATYQPLMKTNLFSHSLKYLTKTYLGYDIQVGFHDPYQDAVSAMRLYKRMCSQDHPMVRVSNSSGQRFIGCSDPWTSVAHERMTIEELLAISRANYECWCLDSQESNY